MTLSLQVENNNVYCVFLAQSSRMKVNLKMPWNMAIFRRCMGKMTSHSTGSIEIHLQLLSLHEDTAYAVSHADNATVGPDRAGIWARMNGSDSSRWICATYAHQSIRLGCHSFVSTCMTLQPTLSIPCDSHRLHDHATLRCHLLRWFLCGGTPKNPTKSPSNCFDQPCFSREIAWFPH